MTMHRNIATTAARALEAPRSAALIGLVVVVLIPPPRCGMSA
jgi:hypothetical protein